MTQKGITLIEVVIYIGMVTLVLTASLSFAWTIINDQIKQELLMEVEDNGSFVLDKISHYTKRADSIDVQTIYDVHPGRLVLNFITRPQITLDTYQKQITLGDIQTIIRKLRIKHGANPAIDITSDKVTITNFVIDDLSYPHARTLKIDLSLEAINPSQDKTYEAQGSWTTSITVKKR